eukprot:CAMPEP_0194207844 /NCGR_PEP_ID=MMETSP0156-20130528/6477_1 /TAXON_ID=33649 /ORGANISM="Thalassionema nitzschioides, Strain L26-B" /LENGTH=235 /DNA_ID=CAMNT_0038934705 /DNA_START=79 /DNA_END=783 /DNA_ORIENTATION=-
MGSEEEKQTTVEEELGQLSLQQPQQEEAVVLRRSELFGGAITMFIPTTWRDVSDVRQVPDHQEVYQDCTFTCGTKKNEIEGTGGCIVIEILERQEEVDDTEAAKYFFTDLAEANGNVVSEIFNQKVWDVGCLDVSGGSNETTNGNTNLIPRLSARIKACTCSGLQSIAPLRNQELLEEGKSPIVDVELAVARLEAVETDLLISLSMPVSEEGANANKGDTKTGLSSLFLEVLQSL